jgi:hypothetical protein
MKTKTFNKKLTLNKETLANLNNSEMVGVNGGATALPCPSVIETRCFQTACHTICFTLCDICFP